MAPLHGEAGGVGLFAIAGRESVDRNFSGEDLRLLETLTGNVTVALQYDRLEQAVRQLESLQHELERKALYDSLAELATARYSTIGSSTRCRAADRACACCCSTSTSSRRSTTATGTTPATNCCARWPTAYAADPRGRHGGPPRRRRVRAPARPRGRRGRRHRRREAAARDFEYRIDVAGERVRVHVSLGIRSACRAAKVRTRLLRKADVALYEAKRRGKSQYRLFHPSMSDALRRRSLAFELERAVSDEELTVVYQRSCRSRTAAQWPLRRWCAEPPGARARTARPISSPSRRRPSRRRTCAIVLERVVRRRPNLAMPIHANVSARPS